ncbi:MAG: rRNA maturation RNAse YbeY [Patescibacteria group bacterium]
MVGVQTVGYEVPEAEIKKAVSDLVGEADVDVFFVGEDEMRKLHHKYMAAQGYEEELHDVLSFPTEDPRHLGDIVICYPYAVSLKEDLVELCVHGTKHLLGEHHD